MSDWWLVLNSSLYLQPTMKNKSSRIVIKILVIILVVMTSALIANNIKLGEKNTLRPIADGSVQSNKWLNSDGKPCNTASCFNELNDLKGGEYCDGLSDGDTSYIESSTPGATTMFVMDTSKIPNGTKINDLTAVVCGRKLTEQATSFQTALCVNGVCHNAKESIAPSIAYSGATQLYSNLNFVKDQNTKIELGYKFTGTAGRKVRISWLSTTPSYNQNITSGAQQVNTNNIDPITNSGTGTTYYSNRAGVIVVGSPEDKCAQKCASSCSAGSGSVFQGQDDAQGCTSACSMGKDGVPKPSSSPSQGRPGLPSPSSNPNLTNSDINSIVTYFCPQSTQPRPN